MNFHTKGPFERTTIWDIPQEISETLIELSEFATVNAVETTICHMKIAIM
jgi:hypothetical protein